MAVSHLNSHRHFITLMNKFLEEVSEELEKRQVEEQTLPASSDPGRRSLYNLRSTRSEVCQLIKEKYGLEIKPSTLTNWIHELTSLCRYIRLRDEPTKL